jgi:putative heme transporter
MSSAPPPGTGPAPEPGGRDGQRHRHQWGRVVVIVVAAAVLITVIVVDRHTLAQSLSRIGGLDWRWFVAAIACECLSLLAFGLSRRRLLQAEGHQARIGSVMAITYAGNALSMSIPFAGAELAAVFSYRQFRRRGLDPALTGWALGVSAIASSSALALVLVVGAIAGGAPLATALGFLGAAVFALPAITVILALRYPKARGVANRLLTWVVHLVQRTFRRPGVDPAVLDELLERLGTIHLSWPRYAEVFGLAVANWLFDCGCLACAIKATGQPVPWHGLLLAYGAGAVAGSTGVTPGGFLIVETALTGALVLAGLTAGPALGAVLIYRLVNFWMILLGGGIVLIFLSRKRDSQIRPYQRDGQPSPNGEALESGATNGEARPGRTAQPTADHPG